MSAKPHTLTILPSQKGTMLRETLRCSLGLGKQYDTYCNTDPSNAIIFQYHTVWKCKKQNIRKNKK